MLNKVVRVKSIAHFQCQREGILSLTIEYDINFGVYIDMLYQFESFIIEKVKFCQMLFMFLPMKSHDFSSLVCAIVN